MAPPKNSHRSQGGRFAPGRSGNPKGRPPRSQNTADLTLEILEKPVPVMRNGKSETISTLEACIRAQIVQAAQGKMPAINGLLAMLDKTGRTDTMTTEEREERTIKLPQSFTSDEYAILVDPARGREAWQVVTDSGVCEGDKFAKEGQLNEALRLYRMQLADEATTPQTRAACIAGIGIVAYKLLFEKKFDQAGMMAQYALSRNPPFDPQWISVVRAHAQMLGGRPDEAERFYLAVQTPKMSVYALESQILREFEELKSAGIAHPLMSKVQSTYHAAGWTTQRRNVLLDAELREFR